MIARRREYSLFTQSIEIVLLIYCLFIFSFFAVFVFLNHNMQSNLYGGYSKAIDYCLAEIENDLTIVERSILSTLYNNSDLSSLSYSEDVLSISVSETRLQRTLNSYLSCYSTVDGLFFYSIQNDRFVSAVRDPNSFSPAYFKDFMRSPDEPDRYDELRAQLISGGGSYIFYQIGDKYCLAHMFAYNNMIGGIWVDLDTIMEKLEQSTSKDTLCVFFNLSELEEPVGNYPVDPSLLQRVWTKDVQVVPYAGARFLTFQVQPSFCTGSLLLLMPYSQLRQALELHYILQGVFILGLAFCFAATFLLFKSRLRLPIRELYRISAAVRESRQPEVIRLQPPSRCREVREINEEVLHLLEYIASLENQVLKEQLLKKEYELLSLRNQVSPHFLINCLSIISSMAGTSVSRSILRSMISTLAKHLRYTLSSKSYVSLAEEISFVKNYYELNNYRYPDSLSYKIDIRGLCDNATVFPCLILMLSENSIKYNLSTDEKLELHITVWEEEAESGKTFVHLCHQDSGNGFPEQILEDLNRPDPSLKEISDGSRIGLYHIKKRILLAYGGCHGSVHFSNHPETGGAQVDIIFPYISYQDS